MEYGASTEKQFDLLKLIQFLKRIKSRDVDLSRPFFSIKNVKPNEFLGRRFQFCHQESILHVCAIPLLRCE